MLYILSLGALLFFLAHVYLLFAAFARGRFSARRYFYSHLTLWITGFLVFLLAFLFQGKDVSGFLDYFDTPLKKGMILVATLGLSVIAHAIVRLAMMPSRK